MRQLVLVVMLAVVVVICCVGGCSVNTVGAAFGMPCWVGGVCPCGGVGSGVVSINKFRFVGNISVVVCGGRTGCGGSKETSLTQLLRLLLNFGILLRELTLLMTSYRWL